MVCRSSGVVASDDDDDGFPGDFSISMITYSTIDHDTQRTRYQREMRKSNWDEKSLYCEEITKTRIGQERSEMASQQTVSFCGKEKESRHLQSSYSYILCGGWMEQKREVATNNSGWQRRWSSPERSLCVCEFLRGTNYVIDGLSIVGRRDIQRWRRWFSSRFFDLYE